MSFVLEMVVRSSLVLAAGLSVSVLLKNRPAAMRHWVLLTTLVLAAAQPAVNRIIPALSITAPGGDQAASDTGGAHTEMRFELPAPSSAPTPAARIDWLSLIYPVWLGGVAISLAVLLLGAAWLTWLTARSCDAGVHWQIAAEDVRRRLGIRRAVRVAITQHPAMLVTWGVIAPVILLPKSAAAWPADRMQLVLAHEMAHLVRRDWLVQLLAEVLRAVNWFNPLFWIACARLRRESEYACDDIVLELGTAGTEYASHLVDLARSFSAHGRTWLPAPSIARPSTLERRVRAMLNPRLDRHPVSMTSRAALAAMLLAIALPIAAATQAPAAPAGTITDPTGRPLPDATVRLTAVGTEANYETRADANGAFQFGDVPAGDYLLSGRYPGFASQRQRVRLSGGGVTFTLRLAVGTLQETISVRGGGNDLAAGPRSEERAPTYSPSACTPSSGGGQLTPPMKLRDVRPRYKAAWAQSGIEGNILMQAQIGVDGKVRNVDVISPVNVELEDEAIAAVSQWEFSPTYLNCEPIEVRMFVTVSFKLER